MSKKVLSGKIISDKMQKTVVVRVERTKENEKYKKKYRVSKNYKAHVIDDSFKIGDEVLIEECAPISKDKKWKVIKKVNKFVSSTSSPSEDSAAEITSRPEEMPESSKE